ncbi:DUF4625 domain-containing protein [Zunongwangia endophytica]|uniref:DUF4625 domain-containing protein n=1 Tax=Zunongwangia endophytica TaxID=1808945 RepID=A0ABV8HA19_9FLAO|nr:DUF4625 domain-containing protein [Zunongwangia endophytica]MDN3594913.1 DUF4625 domain-containing protein [Zunongwangia endophytica]
MKNFSIKVIGLLTIAFFASCSSDDDNILDTEKPEITINDPVEDEAFAVGGELHFDVDLSDNDALSSYKVDIHNNFDGHTHSGVLNSTVAIGTKQATTVSPWSYNETFQIEGTPQTYHAHEHIQIPAEIAEGPYHLGITVVDASGNENQVYVQVIIGEDHTGEEHGISITDIESEDVGRGSEMHAEAQVTAEHEISSISVGIHGHGLNPEDGEIKWTFDETYDDYSGTSAEFHEHIDIPENAALGEYHMTITVVDAEGNSHSEGVHFHITEANNNADAISFSELTVDEEVKAGEEMHVDTEIASEHGIENVEIHIHFEDGEGWSYEEDFTYEEETSIDFHKHIDVPADAAIGEYHLSIEVTDHDGNTASTDAHFNVVE